jgi:putative transposase
MASLGRGTMNDRPRMSTNEPGVFQFVTLHSHANQPLLASNQAKELLLAKLHETKAEFRLDIAGYVLLNDHIHLLCAMRQSRELASAVAFLCAGFGREWRRLRHSESKPFHGVNPPLWKPDIQAYPLTQADELRTHLNFIHYDPVRHGLVERPADYAWSSLPARIHQGHYPQDWAVMAPPPGMLKVARSLYLST